MAELIEANVPRRAVELFDKGLGAMERNNFTYAMDMFLAALDVEPRYLKARKYLRVASLKKFADSGGGQIAHVISTLTGLPQLIRGLILVKTGKPALALRIGEGLLCRDPLNVNFIKLVAKAAEAADMSEVAIQTLETMRDYYPENTELLIWLGTIYTANNRLDDARECFETVLNLRPTDANAMKAYKDAMARDSMAKGGWIDVKEGSSVRDVIKDIKEAVVLEQESKVMRGEKNVELLIQDTAARIKQEPDNVNYRRMLANLYVQANRFDDAIRTVDEARRLTGSGDAQLDQSLANIRLKQFDYEIGLCKENGDTAGMAAKQAEKTAFLFTDTQRRVERYPNDLPLRCEYGVLLYEHDQINEAIQQLQLSQRNPHSRVRSLYYMGLCFKNKQQLDMAREQLEKAVSEISEMNDLKKEIYYQLGEILESAGNFEQAVNQYYKEIYQVDIGYKDVAAKIEKAYKVQP